MENNGLDSSVVIPSIAAAATHTLLPALPPGFNYAAAIRPSLVMIVIQTAFTAMLVPLLVIILFCTTCESAMGRRELLKKMKGKQGKQET